MFCRVQIVFGMGLVDYSSYRQAYRSVEENRFTLRHDAMQGTCNVLTSRHVFVSRKVNEHGTLSGSGTMENY